MTSDQAAPSQGFPQAKPATDPSSSRRNPFSAASTVVKGLSRIRILMAFEAMKTMKKAAIAMGIMRPL